MLQPEQLKCVPIFATLERAQLAQLVALALEERYGVGQHIFAEGDQGSKFYLLLDGRVRISKFIPGIGEEALAILDAGAYFGEMALIDQSPRSAHAIAHTDVVLGAIEADAFEQLLFVNRDLAYDVLWNFVRTLSVRLRETNDKIKAFFAMSGGF